MNMKSLQALIFGLSMISSPVLLAQAKNTQQLDAKVTTLQKQVGQVQKDMKKLRRLLDNRAMLELFQRMDDLADEVRKRRGLLEQQNHDLAGLKKRQRELYLDTDRRLREVEITSSRASAVDSTPPPVVTTQPEPAEPAVEAAVPVVVPPVPAPVVSQVPEAVATGTTRPATVSAADKPVATMSEERAAYQKAFDMLKEGRYKTANAAFKRFVNQYPDSSYAGNSQYWLGESNYVTRQFKQAIEEFQAVLTKYPNSNKVPDAMLKLGYTYYELQDFPAAKSILDKLRNSYPKSTAARLAGKRLDRMRKEGH